MSPNALVAPASAADHATRQLTRLAVTWQHPVNRRHEPVGLLVCDDRGFQFRYLRRADEVEGFQPFLGFDDLDRVYSAPRLFPLFAQRVMSPSRPDFPRYLRSLLLTPSATERDILARSQGQREGDGIRVFVEPAVDDSGRTEATFLVHGVRHRLHADPRVEQVLRALVPDEQLRLVDEPDNPADPRAVLVSHRSGVALGWVPSVLLAYVHVVSEAQVRVLHANGPDVPPGYRLIVRLNGRVSPGYRAFDGPAWALRVL